MRPRLAIGILLAVAVVGTPRGSRAQSAPTLSSLTGEQLFATSCGFCHQAGGRVAGRGPKLAGTDRPDEYLLNRIRVGKEGAMPAYGRAFTDIQLRSLVVYIRSLKDDGQ